MKFSQKIGKVPVRKVFQLDDIDKDLRNSLWNSIYVFFLDRLPFYTYEFEVTQKFVIETLWLNFYKIPVDEIPEKSKDVIGHIKKWFFAVQWFNIYDLIEFVEQEIVVVTQQKFKEHINNILEREMSGYRLVGNSIANITDNSEVFEIEEAILKSSRGKLSGVKEHILLALKKMSDRENPDYRNSIKESISSVESICRIITNDSKAELGKALNLIEQKLGLHKALIKGFSSIYGYTSDKSGIRHSLHASSDLEFEDAKFMVVSCSAFVNYLIIKADKMGVNL
jgi:hypothetical protein